MADAAVSPQADRDRDLASMAEARALARRAKQACTELAEFSQQQIDLIVAACAEAATLILVDRCPLLLHVLRHGVLVGAGQLPGLELRQKLIRHVQGRLGGV